MTALARSFSLLFALGALIAASAPTDAQNANVVFRNDGFGINPPCYQPVNLPVLGTTFQVTVDITGDINNFTAWYAGYAAPLAGTTTNLGILLVNPLSTLLAVDLRVGFNQVHLFDISIPNDPGLAGLTVYSQGFIQNIASGFTLCNALDVTLGF